MIAISTWEDVIAAVRKSRLLTSQQLEQAVEATRGLSTPSTIARKLVTANLLTRWQAAEIISGHTDLSLGKYRLLDQSGFTDLGRVLLGEHVKTGRRVQCSTIEQTGNRDSEAFQRFIAEVRKIAGISHPNLVQIIEIVVEDKVAYLVTEHVEGRDLQRVVDKEHPLPPETAADYVRQAAAGMAEIHAHGLVHRELRPSNLLLTEQGRVKVGGMSLACLAQNPPQKATTADAVNYLAPEQVQQDGVGPASDVYALGAIFYHLLAMKKKTWASAIVISAK